MADHSRLAAKFGRGASIADGELPPYHPLVCHMADVAAVALAMWDLVLPASSRSMLSRGLGVPEDEARVWVGFLAGAHDFGKATRPFQAKDTAGHGARLAGSGLDARTRRPDPGHGRVTAALLPEYLARELHVERRLAATLAVVTGGHHGIFPVVDREGSLVSLDEEDPATHTAWATARLELFGSLRRLLGVKGTPDGVMPAAASMLLAGLISISDWVGSIADEGYFKWDPGGARDLDNYFDRVMRLARDIMRRDRWLDPLPKHLPAGFATMFGLEPRPLQEAAERLAENLPSPGLVVIEAPMGEGKTEAALYLARHWSAAGARGMYIGLPTQATANQMHSRVSKFLSDNVGGDAVNLVLAHGRAWLQDPAFPRAVDGADGQATVAAGEWFLPKKRSLLAPFGVGTIDQSLMAVLQVRHMFVRLFGLAGKPVVIDEVHAYDTYMTGLLERLLEWLAALGSPVVLLSATLPRSRRQRLAEAYVRGLPGPGSPPSGPPDTPYPRVTLAGVSGIDAESFPASPQLSRVLQIHQMNEADGDLADRLPELLADGGCAAVICNTVGRAQDVYRLLAAVFAPGKELGLFHSRFLAKDRAAVETACLGRFGPPADPEVRRPTRYVLVATQVMEQSLDVDFDVMVSDLAPVDLLLQRSGRLQRHQRDGRKGGPATLHIRWPNLGVDGLPQLDRGSSAVYDPHILLRTWWALKDQSVIHIPDDVEGLVDTVYEEEEAPPDGADGTLLASWHETWEAMQRKKEHEDREARQRRLATPNSRGFITQFLRDPREEDSDLHPALQALTRLAEPSVSVVLLAPGETIPSSVGRDDVIRMLDRTVDVTNRGLVPVLQRIEPPGPFARSPALRRHRCFTLDEAGVARVEGWVLEYNADLGLRISKEESE